MEDTESIVTRLPSSPLTKQIANQPEALKALNDFFALLKESGKLPIPTGLFYILLNYGVIDRSRLG